VISGEPTLANTLTLGLGLGLGLGLSPTPMPFNPRVSHLQAALVVGVARGGQQQLSQHGGGATHLRLGRGFGVRVRVGIGMSFGGIGLGLG